MKNSNDIRSIFKNFRTAIQNINESSDDTNGGENNEGTSQKDGGVAYTQQDEIYKNSLQVAKEQFGADFSNVKTPMFYYQKDGDVTLSGEIPELNNARFQFRYKDPSSMGCFIWTDSLILSDENINKLSRIYGVYKNWKNDLSTAEDIKPMAMRNSEE